MYAWIYQSICYKIGFQDLDYEITASIGKFILFSVSMCSYMFFFITKWLVESVQQRTELPGPQNTILVTFAGLSL